MARRGIRLVARLCVAMALAVPMGALQTGSSEAAVTYKLELKVSGLSSPIYMIAPPGSTSRYFIVEKGGVIRIATVASPRWKLLSTPFLDISSRVSTDGERGLLSMAFDPGYNSNRRFYVYYTDNSGTIVISRFLRMASDPNRADPNSEVVLDSIGHPTYNNHNGGQLQIDPIAAKNGQAILYYATGDGGGSGDPNDNAQNLSSPLGKMWRMDVGAANPTPELYAYGLRNPWRFSFDRLNGSLRIGDVGQDSWEELDYIKHGEAPGLNFGWRKYEGNHLYHDENIDESRLRWPFQEYPHTNGNCAVIGGYMYRGSIQSLYGYYLYADLCSANIWRRYPGHSPIKMGISGTVSDIVSFAEGNLGGLFIVSIDGAVYRLTST